MFMFNSVVCRQHFPPAWKHPLVASRLKPGKDLTLRSSYRPIRLLDIVDMLFEKILFTRVLREGKKRGLAA
jgi:hypothetical protein